MKSILERYQTSTGITKRFEQGIQVSDDQHSFIISIISNGIWCLKTFLTKDDVKGLEKHKNMHYSLDRMTSINGNFDLINHRESIGIIVRSGYSNGTSIRNGDLHNVLINALVYKRHTGKDLKRLLIIYPANRGMFEIHLKQPIEHLSEKLFQLHKIV